MIQIAVIGGSYCDQTVAQQAREVGRLLAQRGAVLICGGLGGVMEAAARGAREAGGLTIGILPGADLTDANPSISIPIATGMGHARNVIVVLSAHAIIAFPGAMGTLSEIALAGTAARPVIDFGGWIAVAGLTRVSDPMSAVTAALQAAETGSGVQP